MTFSSETDCTKAHRAAPAWAGANAPAGGQAGAARLRRPGEKLGMKNEKYFPARPVSTVGSLIALLFSAVPAVSSPQAGMAQTSCSIIADWDSRGVPMNSVYHWATGYWTGYNLYLSASCKEKRDLSRLSENPAVTMKLIGAHCALNPDLSLITAAFQILKTMPVITGTKSASC